MFSYTNVRSFFKNGNRPVIIRALFVSVIFGLSVAAGSSDVKAQIAPKAPVTKKTEPATTSSKKIVRGPRIRSGSPEDSYNFLLLGDRFYEKGRWNAAEAAYKESIRLWPGSAAHAALKDLHEVTRVK
jgi:hypothetical protein